MGKIDKEKEYIGALKAYLGFIFDRPIVILGAIVLFAYVVKILHTHIDKLEEL